MATKYTIKKDGNKWRVEHTGGPSSPKPGDQLEWKFENPAKGQEAHSQFTDPALVDTSVQGQPEDHWTKVIENAATLNLKLVGRPSRGHIHYAVFVIPDKVFAIGHNPPPKIDVGP